MSTATLGSLGPMSTATVGSLVPTLTATLGSIAPAGAGEREPAADRRHRADPAHRGPGGGESEPARRNGRGPPHNPRPFEPLLSELPTGEFNPPLIFRAPERARSTPQSAPRRVAAMSLPCRRCIADASLTWQAGSSDDKARKLEEELKKMKGVALKLKKRVQCAPEPQLGAPIASLTLASTKMT
eukprot:6132684-Pyramimonas_sp.AAC.1